MSNHCAHIWLDTSEAIGVKRWGLYHHIYPFVCQRCHALRGRNGQIIEARKEPIEGHVTKEGT